MADLRSSLTAIYQRHGELTPQHVVDEARPETSELHHRFEWDDALAGEAYRRTQAADLIRSVRIQYAVTQQGERKYVRAFQSVRESGDTERSGYQPTDEVVRDELATKILLKQFERDITDMNRKYGHLSEYAQMMRAAGEEVAS